MNLEKLLIVRNIIFSYICKLLPMKKNSIYFISFRGQYNGNPKAISLELKKDRPNAAFYWEITEKCHEVIPSYIHKVKPGSLRSIWIRSRCKVVIDNYLGWSYGYCGARNLKYKILLNQRKRGQINVCTWHGVPLKRIARDEPGRKDRSLHFYTTANFLTCNSEYMKAIFERLTDNQIAIVMTGWPRNDLLYEVDEKKKEELKRKLGIPLDKKVVLYAPTFREEGAYMSGICQLKSMNIESLLLTLKRKYEGNWCFVFRAHDSVFLEIEKMEINVSDVINGNIGDDMAEYLYITDVLITDYSGSLFDFASTKRPCYLFSPDLEHYSKQERGLYLDIKKLPFTTAVTFEQLIDNIRDFDNEKYEKQLVGFQKDIGSVDDGQASQRVVEIIKRYM